MGNLREEVVKIKSQMDGNFENRLSIISQMSSKKMKLRTVGICERGANNFSTGREEVYNFKKDEY